MGLTQESFLAFDAGLYKLVDNAAQGIHYDLLIEQADSLQRHLGEIQSACSGYFSPVEDALLHLQSLLAQRAVQAVVYAAIQQLVCQCGLCIGAYLYGSAVIRKVERCKYVLPSLINEVAGMSLSAFFVFDSTAVANEIAASLAAYRDAGIRVTAIVQSGAAEGIHLPEGVTLVCLPMPRGLPALFDLAYYLCDTALFLFSHDFLWNPSSAQTAAAALLADKRLAYVALEKSGANAGKVVWGFPEGTLSGVYRKSAAAKIGAQDPLFSEESYLCEDYRIRAAAHDYAAGTLSCICDEALDCHFPSGIARDGEALLKKHGRELPPKLDKAFIYEFFQQLHGKNHALCSAALYHDGDDRMAKIIAGYLSAEWGAAAYPICVMDVRGLQAPCQADLIVFCFPAYLHRSFDHVLQAALQKGDAAAVAFFDINYMAGDNLEKVLSDRGFEGKSIDAFSIYFRKSLRDKITGCGYDAAFSRITRDVPEQTQAALRMIFPDSCDMMLRNLQTKYYAYVCTKRES